MTEQSARRIRQGLVAQWCQDAFGVEQAQSLPQRGIRLVEESVEAAQAAGTTKEMIHRLVDYVYSRPVGKLPQELGGVGVTLLALAAAAGLDADEAEAIEVSRVLAKPLAEFRERNAAKNAAGFQAGVRPADDNHQGVPATTDESNTHEANVNSSRELKYLTFDTLSRINAWVADFPHHQVVTVETFDQQSLTEKYRVWYWHVAAKAEL